MITDKGGYATQTSQKQNKAKATHLPKDKSGNFCTATHPPL